MFQRLMDSVLRGLDFIFVYLDDILMASRSKQEHRAHVPTSARALTTAGPRHQFGQMPVWPQEIDFLGHHINKHGTTPLPSKVAAIREFARLSTVKGLQGFIGMVNFYHRLCQQQLASCNLFSRPSWGNPKKYSGPRRWYQLLTSQRRC